MAERPCVRGKFLFLGDEKLYVRGATYGTFRPDAWGEPYPAPAVVARDFAQMENAGFNAIRTYTLPPRWLLDLAAEHGLFVMVGVAWEQHVDFLEDRGRARSIEDRVRAGVASLAGHPAVLCYAVGNEIPAEIVRWRGRRPIERYIARLYDAAKHEDPDGLVTYVNYPPTEYLQLPFLDLMCFNVYLEARRDLDAYLARLHNIAGERPLLMAELGLDSRAHGELAQAETLDWQVRTALAAGCAGTFVFAWTDDWYVSYLSEMAAGGEDIRDWDFGLTRRNRHPKPALDAVSAAFDETPFGPRTPWPQISVVVCTFNGERTLRSCLDGLLELDYPDFEVIVVNDGSTDATASIAAEYDIHLIDTENHGLATARNLGLQAARGEIVAYLDDDARPDPHWLRYLALAFERQPAYAGVGGPNSPPVESPLITRCVGDAPGGPTHVLLSDREAEHIPGCNMAFRRQALADIGGFDPQFRVAGDDVDICWRLIEAGHQIGFSPAALVWHEPRRSIGAYWRQQRAYGEAEAMLERKWPDRYGTAGRARWDGRLYGSRAVRGLGRWRVYHGVWGSGLFQSLYGPEESRLGALVLGPEWLLLTTVLGFMSLVALLWSQLMLAVPLFIAAVAAWFVLAGVSAIRAGSMSRPRQRREQVARMTVAILLHATQPLARLWGRARGARSPARENPRPVISPLPVVLSSWSESWSPREQRLAAIEGRLRSGGTIVSRGGAFDRWDLDARHGWLGGVRIRMAVEEHGGGRQLVRFEARPRWATVALALIAMLAILALAAFADSAMPAAVALGAAAIVLGMAAVRAAGEAMSSVLERVAVTEGERTEKSEARELELTGT